MHRAGQRVHLGATRKMRMQRPRLGARTRRTRTTQGFRGRAAGRQHEEHEARVLRNWCRTGTRSELPFLNGRTQRMATPVPLDGGCRTPWPRPLGGGCRVRCQSVARGDWPLAERGSRGQTEGRHHHDCLRARRLPSLYTGDVGRRNLAPFDRGCLVRHFWWRAEATAGSMTTRDGSDVVTATA